MLAFISGLPLVALTPSSSAWSSKPRRPPGAGTGSSCGRQGEGEEMSADEVWAFECRLPSTHIFINEHDQVITARIKLYFYLMSYTSDALWTSLHFVFLKPLLCYSKYVIYIHCDTSLQFVPSSNSMMTRRWDLDWKHDSRALSVLETVQNVIRRQIKAKKNKLIKMSS